MIEYTSLVESSTGNLTHAMNDLATRGWTCKSVFQSKGDTWVAFMERGIVVEVKHGMAKAVGWGSTRNELPLSERRALAGDPAAYRSADDLKQKEPGPQ